jgi:hypothetical protein
MNKPTVKLIGANGNAFNIVALCRQAARRAGWTKEQVDAMVTDMMSGDYDHVIATAMEKFDVV